MRSTMTQPFYPEIWVIQQLGAHFWNCRWVLGPSGLQLFESVDFFHSVSYFSCGYSSLAANGHITLCLYGHYRSFAHTHFWHALLPIVAFVSSIILDQPPVLVDDMLQLTHRSLAVYDIDHRLCCASRSGRDTLYFSVIHTVYRVIVV